MNSRLRESPESLFEVFMEVAKPDGQITAPFILQKYPADYADEDVLKSSPKFAYPCEIDCTTVDHYTFVFTDIDGKFKFGFCRHTPGSQTTLCIISCLPWFEIFYKLLNMVAEILNRSELNSCIPLLKETYFLEIPMPTIPVTIVAQQEMFSFTGPDPNQLPRIPTSRNLTEYYSAMDTHNMMIIFAHMLNERRVLVTSRKLSRLTSCIHAAQALLYPMSWQHLFIPLLPAHGNLIEYVSAPMPYLIGVHSSLLPKVLKMEIDDAVIVDADHNTVLTSHTDFTDLPEDVAMYLKKCLRQDKLKNSMMESGDAISQAFLQALVRLIGGYRDALKFRPDEPITFDPDLFVTSRTASMRGFLENMLQLQIFQQFINNRLDMLNAGCGFSDIFEQQSLLYADKLNTQSRYKDWQNQMKLKGRKLQKGGKDMWSDLRERVKIQSKRAYSDIKAKINEINDKGSSSRSSPKINRNRPNTIVGHEIKKERVYREMSSPEVRTPGESNADIPYVDFDSNSLSSSSSSTDIKYQNTQINTKSSEVVFDKKITGGNIPPPRPPMPKMNKHGVEKNQLKLEAASSATCKIEPSPLISFNDDDKPKVKNEVTMTFSSDQNQNDLIFSWGSGAKQSPQHASLNRNGAFRHSDRSPKVQLYKADIYSQKLPEVKSEMDSARLFDPLANCDKLLPDVKQNCDIGNLLADFMSDSPKPTKGERANVDLNSFDPLAMSSELRQTNSLQPSRSANSRSFEDIFSNTTLDNETASFTSISSTRTTGKKSPSPFSTWTTFE